MQRIKSCVLPLVFLMLTITLTSSVPTGKENTLPKDEKLKILLEKTSKIDKSTSYSDMKKIAEEFKGEKLSFKEKLGLKLFGKKIATKLTKANGDGSKSQLVALILVIFVGTLGIHRFYLGYTTIGIIQLLTLGGCGIWALIDLIRIITGDLTPKDGGYDKTL
jgi:TM2 domain-containing membrane protein YozV